ncbi:hypothetical protein FHS18_003617 [Paenibacillus phyllosphaerae]|uniref:Uncharacterized protein n=1 Tax=Paenibacillus phyllosphaerae TaxID=274593 RepID=A0A7W5AZY4_9BACL|nr:hypothetical protein [Paenibacillus phyllosphaerae]MBB3111549.1 hypothetical protein [Paenibacillus phyllosphaerae]
MNTTELKDAAPLQLVSPPASQTDTSIASREGEPYQFRNTDHTVV